MKILLSCFLAFSLVRAIGQEPRLVFPIGHSGSLTKAVFTADGKKIITASDDGTTRIWDVHGRQLQKLSNSEANNEIEGVEASANGEIIITRTTGYRTNSSIIKVWNAYSGKATASHFGSNARVTPDGMKIIISNGNRIKIVEPAGNKVLFELKDHGGFHSFLDLNASGTLLASAPDLRANAGSVRNDTIKIWDLVTGQLKFFLSPNQGNLTALKFSKDGNLVVGATQEGLLNAFDTRKGELLCTINTGKAYDYLELNEEGNLLVATTLGADKEVDVWSISEKRKIYSIGLGKEIFLAEADPAGKTMSASSNDSTIVFNVKDGKQIFSKGLSPDVLAVSADGKLFLSPVIYDLKSKRDIAELKLAGTVKPFEFAAFDGRQNLVTTQGNNTGFWDAGKAFRFTGLFSNQSVIALNGSKIASYAPEDSSLYLWNVETKKQIQKLSNVDINKSIVELESGKILITFGRRATLKNINPGAKPVELSGHSGTITYATMNSKCSRALTYADDGTIILWNTVTGKLVARVDGLTREVVLARISNDGTSFLTYSRDKVIRLYNSAGAFMHAMVTYPGISFGGMSSEDDTAAIRSIAFSPDSKQILVMEAGYADAATIWNVATGKPAIYLQSDKELSKRKMVRDAVYSQKGEMVLVNYQDYTAAVFDAASGLLISQLAGHGDIIISGSFSPDAKKVMTVSLDNTAKIWSASTGKLLYTFFAIDSADYFVQLESKYYTSSREATRQLYYVTPDLKVITFEQLDLKYNRPDKVLKEMGSTDRELIRSYQTAYNKRIRRLGLDTILFTGTLTVPQADFVGREKIEYVQHADRLTLQITAKDSLSNLNRFNLWVNEVPLFGRNGVSLAWRKTGYFDTTVTIPLSDGINIIETSVTSESGLESYRAPLQVSYTPSEPKQEKIYFVGIGIDKFADSGHNLQYSVKDIRDFLTSLKIKYGGNLVIVDTIFDQNVANEAISGIKEKLKATSINDKVIISYSGHGLLSGNYDYYLSTYNINFQKPEENGLAYEALENLLDGIPARRKLMLIDACHSGEVDKEELQKYTVLKDSLAKKGTKGFIVVTSDSARLGMKNSFELMRELFVNVGRSTGATIISAAGGMQLAQEGGGRENGVFTYSVLEYMDKFPTATISELKNYVNKRVPELTKGLQQPTTRTESMVVDWRVW